MKLLKNLTVLCGTLAVLSAVTPVFAATAMVDVDRVLFEYTKAKEAATQFQAQEKALENDLINAQNKVKAAKTPVEKKTLEETYDKQLRAKAEKIKNEQLKKLKEIDTEVMSTISKINANGKYDVILRKSATVYCKNDITDEVIRKLNGK
ncbi:MAG: OmpH family outer membrane protein [Candidatus Gastranaerophilales bacterium]|nr:OmpH family outer membrane protein [Candidatus Gastranaerophilales bacterium]